MDEVLTREMVVRELGEPEEVEAELDRARRAARLLSSSRARLIAHYDGKWVAVYDGVVRASAGTLENLMADIDGADVPREDVIVRLISRDEITMIL